MMILNIYIYLIVVFQIKNKKLNLLYLLDKIKNIKWNNNK